MKVKAWPDEKSFNIEMEKRFKELKDGTVERLTLEQLEASARELYKRKHKL